MILDMDSRWCQIANDPGLKLKVMMNLSSETSQRFVITDFESVQPTRDQTFVDRAKIIEYASAGLGNELTKLLLILEWTGLDGFSIICGGRRPFQSIRGRVIRIGSARRPISERRERMIGSAEAIDLTA